MVFLNPLMLLGVGAAVLPLVLHLLSRSRYRTIDWGGMIFLTMGPDARQRRSARMHRWILLLLRMAMIAALAVALARPVLRGPWGTAAQGGRLAAVIVLDCSGSMAFEENGTPRIDLARGAARQVLEALEPGDSAALILTGIDVDPQGQPPVPLLTTDLQSVAEQIATVRAGAGKADLPQALRQALDVLQQAGEGVRDIYVICDRQRLGWDAVRDGPFAATWKAHQQTSHPTRLMILPVGSIDVQNVMIESLELQTPPAIRGHPAEMEVKLRNYGPVQRAALPLAIEVNGKKIYETKVDLGPDSFAVVKTPVKLDAAGSYIVEASVVSTGLTTDDSLEAAIEVVEPVKVLIVSGDERPAAFRSESDFLSVALAPFAATGQQGDADASVVQVIPVEQWSDVQLADFGVVILANVESLLPSQIKALEQFTYERGGGILVTLGNLTRADDYNKMLYRDGAGLLPAELQPATPADGSQATSLLGYRSEHPIFRFLRTRPGLLPSATVGRYFPVPATTQDPSARSLAEYLSGDSFLMEKSFGKGRVLLLTTTIDTDWNTLPLSNFFLPFVQSTARYLSAQSMLRTNLIPPQPIRLIFDTPANERTAMLTLPDGREVSLPVLRYGANPEVRYDQTERPGRYTLRIREDGKERVQHFVVRGPQGESNLARMEEEDWRAVERDLGARRLEPGKVEIAAGFAGARGGQELWWPALGIVFLLGLLELLVGRTAAVESGAN